MRHLFGNDGNAKQEVDFNYRRPFAVTVTPGAAAVPGATPAASFTPGESIGPVYLDTTPE